MKIRKGFVSNSSSSSFSCQVCGEEYSGWDLSLDETDLYDCVNGHTFCEEHALEFTADELRKEVMDNAIERLENEKIGKNYYKEIRPDRIKDAEKNIELIKNCTDDDEFIDNYASYEEVGSHYEYTSLACPICNYKEVDSNDALRALKLEFDIDTDEKLIEIIKKHIKY